MASCKLQRARGISSRFKQWIFTAGAGNLSLPVKKAGGGGMNNKQIGTEFEREMCAYLKREGYWAHFITPDARGAQPFDIIAVKDGEAFAIDCKTSAKPVFPLSRLEDNQIAAFDYWIKCGNLNPMVAVKYNGGMYLLSYPALKRYGKMDIVEDSHFKVEKWI